MHRRAFGLAIALLLAACGRVGYDPSATRDGGADLDAVVDMQDEFIAVDDMAAVDDMPDMGEAVMFLVSPIDGLTTTEAGGTATFNVMLSTAPTGNVTMMLSSSDTGEGRITPPVIAFSTTNWNAPHTVTVTGVDDADTDGDQMFTAVTAPAVSSDARFNGLNADDVSVTNVDNESAGVTVSRTSGLSTSEAGAADTFTVVLNSAPASDVSITLSSSRPSEGTVSPDTLTFTSSNWASAQTVTVTGVDDAVVDGDQGYTVTTSATTSASAAYNGLDVDDVTATNLDDETAAILVSPTMGLTTAESGATASFTVVLQAAPSADVLIPIASTDLGEGTVSSTSIVFTTADWSVPQAVLVTGVDDAIADGDQVYQVTIGASASADPAYDGLSGASVTLSNSDDESAGLTISPTTGLVTTEAGATASFSIVLTTAPASTVTIDLTSSDPSEATISPPSLSFTTVNWNSPQMATLTGVDDLLTDGDQSYNVTAHVAPASDAAYAALADRTISATNTDDESPGVTVTPTSGLTTSEFGAMASFSVVLNAAPIASVLISLDSDLTSEGTVSTTTLAFTPGNWSTPQLVSVTGVDDAFADGARVFHVVTAAAITADPAYSGLDPSDVTITNTDNDSAGISVTPTSVTVSEGGSADVFSVTLTSQPTATVAIPVAMLNVAQGTVSPASLSFTASNWASPHIVSVAAVNDAIADGTYMNTAQTLPASSTDVSYNGVDGADVSVTTLDNDGVGIVVSPTAGLSTTENGGTATFALHLNSQPTASVTVSISSSDLTEGTVSPATVTFTTADWASNHVVTVTGVGDALTDGNVDYTIVTGNTMSTDGAYNGLPVSDVSVTNLDNTARGVSITPLSGSVTTEAGGVATIGVVLVSAPTADVTISVASSDLSEGTVSTALLTFTPLNWSVAQTITVTGANDLIDDGNVLYTIVTGNTSSADVGYNNLAVADPSVTNTDNDTAAILRSSGATPVNTWEGGGSNQVTVTLQCQPTADVTVNVVSTDLTETTVAPASLTFTSGNWSTPQAITLGGVDDALYDGDVIFDVTLTASSADAAYAALAPVPVSVRNTDDDGFQRGSRDSSSQMTSGQAGTVYSMDSSGRYLAMYVAAWANLVPEDTNGTNDVYVLDRTNLSLQLVSRAQGGAVGNGASYSISGGITRNAQFAVFETSATNFGFTDTNGHIDVVKSDLSTGELTRVSVSSIGAELNQDAYGRNASEDGRYVLFATTATNAVPGDSNGVSDLFVHDTLLNVTTLVSQSTAGVIGNAGAGAVGTISADGRYVVFGSLSSNLVAGDTNGQSDIFVRDTLLGTTTRVSLNSSGAQSIGSAVNPDMTPDGRYVIYTSSGNDIDLTDTNGFSDIFVRDLMLGTVVRVSQTSTGMGVNSNSSAPSISDDGQRVAFVTSADNVVPGDTNGLVDAFVYDRALDMVARVSISNSGVELNAMVSTPRISGDGRYVSMRTGATNTFATGGWVWTAVTKVPF